MFATFKISPAGLRKTHSTKKHSRTLSGCLTCMLSLPLLVPFWEDILVFALPNHILSYNRSPKEEEV
jgi:hypothetical protein